MPSNQKRGKRRAKKRAAAAASCSNSNDKHMQSAVPMDAVQQDAEDLSPVNWQAHLPSAAAALRSVLFGNAPPYSDDTGLLFHSFSALPGLESLSVEEVRLSCMFAYEALLNVIAPDVEQRSNLASPDRFSLLISEAPTPRVNTPDAAAARFALTCRRPVLGVSESAEKAALVQNGVEAEAIALRLPFVPGYDPWPVVEPQIGAAPPLWVEPGSARVSQELNDVELDNSYITSDVDTTSSSADPSLQKVNSADLSSASATVKSKEHKVFLFRTYRARFITKLRASSTREVSDDIGHGHGLLSNNEHNVLTTKVTEDGEKLNSLIPSSSGQTKNDNAEEEKSSTNKEVRNLACSSQTQNKASSLPSELNQSKKSASGGNQSMASNAFKTEKLPNNCLPRPPKKAIIPSINLLQSHCKIYPEEFSRSGVASARKSYLNRESSFKDNSSIIIDPVTLLQNPTASAIAKTASQVTTGLPSLDKESEKKVVDEVHSKGASSSSDDSANSSRWSFPIFGNLFSFGRANTETSPRKGSPVSGVSPKPKHIINPVNQAAISSGSSDSSGSLSSLARSFFAENGENDKLTAAEPAATLVKSADVHGGKTGSLCSSFPISPTKPDADVIDVWGPRERSSAGSSPAVSATREKSWSALFQAPVGSDGSMLNSEVDFEDESIFLPHVSNGPRRVLRASRTLQSSTGVALTPTRIVDPAPVSSAEIASASPSSSNAIIDELSSLIGEVSLDGPTADATLTALPAAEATATDAELRAARRELRRSKRSARNGSRTAKPTKRRPRCRLNPDNEDSPVDNAPPRTD